MSRKLHLPGTAPGTQICSKLDAIKKKRAESLHLPGIKPHSPAIQSAIRSQYWFSYQGSYTGCASNNTIGNMLISNKRILKFAIWYVQCVFLLPRTLPHRLQLSCMFARTVSQKKRPNYRYSRPFGWWTSEYLATFETPGIYWQKQNVCICNPNTTLRTFNPSKYQGNKLFQVLGYVTLSTR